MKYISIRTDLLKTRGITPLGKILLSYFSIVYYVAGDGFSFNVVRGAERFGTTEKRLQTALSNLTAKKYISTFSSFGEESVSVYMNKKLLNKTFNGFLTEKPKQEFETEENELEDMVRTVRREKGLSKHTYLK